MLSNLICKTTNDQIDKSIEEMKSPSEKYLEALNFKKILK